MVLVAEQKLPSDGLAGFIENWRSDLVAGVSVALVALPLAMGIAIAADLPPISGLISAIVGGLITTLIRSSHVAINGPANGLIVVLLIAVEALRDASGVSYPYVLAACVVAGTIQVLMGFLRFGKLGNYFPASVIQGMLAAFGVIIIGKQIHTAVGHHVTGTVIETFKTLPSSIMSPNVPILIIALVSLLILIVHSQVKNRTVHFLPAPVWVLLWAVPAAYLFDLARGHNTTIYGKTYPVGPEFLIRVPESLIDSMVFPDFSRMDELVFWNVVLTLCFVTSVETVLSAKVVDKLDPYRRRTDLNRDLAAVGVSTVVSGFLGGLPVTAVIIRSSVNINHGAQTRWSNFFHGSILLLSIILIPNLIQEVPLAALAAILVFTGFRLAGPKVFRDALRKGNDQVFLLTTTLLAVLFLGLLQGIVAGLGMTLLLHWLWSGIPPSEFLRDVLRPDFQLVQEDSGTSTIRVRGVVCFLNLFWLERLLARTHGSEAVVVDLGNAKLVDATTQEFLHECEVRSDSQRFDILGLSQHLPSSAHPMALRRRHSPLQERKSARLTQRQRRLAAIAESKGWQFDPDIDWEPLAGRVFHFFESRPIEYRRNILRGSYEELGVSWEVEDVTFDEGAFLATEEHHTTIQYLTLPLDLPPFAVERRGFLDRLLEFAGYRESDFVVYPDVSSEFVIRSLPGLDIGSLFTPALLDLLDEQPLYHFESNGSALILFRHDRLAGPAEIESMVWFSQNLVELLLAEGRAREQADNQD